MSTPGVPGLELAGARTAAIALGAEARARRGIVAGRYVPRDRAVRRALAVSDTLAIVVAIGFVDLFVANRNGAREAMWGLVALPAILLLFNAYGLYRRDSKRISHSTLDDLPWLFHALVVGSLLLWLYYHVTIRGGIKFLDLLAFSCVTIVSVTVFRKVARHLVHARRGPERVLLLGDAEAINVVARKMRAHSRYRAEPVARIATSGTQRSDIDLPIVGRLTDLDLSAVVSELDVERIVLAQGELAEPTLLEFHRRCKELSVKVSVLPELCDVMGPSVEIDDVEGVTLLGINPPVLSPSSRMAKRCMDLVGASVMLIFAAPLMALIAIAIKLDSRGPVLFHQVRVGRRDTRFALLKFRTMVTIAEQMTEQLRAQSKDPHWLHLEHDPRITRLGRLLRSTSLDELPQLWNVLRGQMSLVGPRPLIEAEDSLLLDWARNRIDLTPGLTGLWQVLGRTSIPFEEMVKLDYIYVTNWSLWTDVRLMVRTVAVVLSRRGAN
jgi:exopolysaccharide biosynthesis polyprenyl glycosylphosphotransferase